ncbi:MAG: SGNH/GDSL hydrolase family protein [Bacteroidetes bacterium]|nr:MAG: SGNH/GDSL hydrolase family protein [Bacteroidota bacterium]
MLCHFRNITKWVKILHPVSKSGQIYSFRLCVQLLCLLSFCQFFVGCTTSKKEALVPPVKASKTYLALGDSYTIGQGVLQTERFPYLAAQWLTTQGVDMLSPTYIATTGWTTADLLRGIANTNPPSNFDAVTLLIGVNNQFQGRDTNEYRREFTQCLQEAIRLARNKTQHVFVLSIPDYSSTPVGRRFDSASVSAGVNRFNAINRQITEQYRVVYIDITPGSRQASTDPGLVASDGLHPSGREYEKWAALLAPAMVKVLK